MEGKVRPIPEGYHTVTPYRSAPGAPSAIEFYKKAFDAIEVMRMPQPDGRIGHADIRIGNSHVMLADVDAFVERAVRAGATQTRPIENQFYGDRAGAVLDPFGHTWHVATHVADVPREEMARRMKAKSGGS